MTKTDARWYEQAECRPGTVIDHQWFDLTLDSFDGRESPEAAARRHAAGLQRCAGCPVAVECLEDARFYNDVGVRGGQVLTGILGQSRATRDQRSRAATNRALRVLEEARAS